MAEQFKPIDLSTVTLADLLGVFDEVQHTRRPRRVQRNGQDVGTIGPAKAARTYPPSSVLPVTEDDPLLGLIGIGESDTPGDISANKLKYLAKAKRALSP